MSESTQQSPCAECSDPVAAGEAHNAHEPDCPNNGMHFLFADCACDLVVHPGCCQVPVCQRMTIDELRLELARSTTLLALIAKRMVIQTDRTATVTMPKRMVASLKEYVAEQAEARP